MKPITFENLRRLVGGGGRKKKDKESSFRRSDSFKRISIRKSYLDRGKKKQHNISKLEVATQTVAEEDLCNLIESINEQTSADVSVQVDKLEFNQLTCDNNVNCDKKCNNTKKYKEYSKSGPGQSVIAYGHWLKGIRTNESPPNQSGIKGSERTIIYVPASDEIRTQTPVIRQLSSSPVQVRRKPHHSPNNLQRKESNDSAVEMFPWGDSCDFKKSPLLKKRPSRHQSPVSLMPDSGVDEMCSLSISLGRIWMDAPQGMAAPRSLELPKPSDSVAVIHHSLDSALKERREESIVLNRLQKRPTSPSVMRTLSSSTSYTTASTGLFSSKDSGFSFSISAPKLNDFGADFIQACTSGGFFRKKKRPKPKLSVSRDGYFKRTGGLEVRRNSVKRRSSKKKKKGNKKRNNSCSRSDIYQVVVSRPARSLRVLNLDPMIFVPPEKRKSLVRKPSFHVGMREIRNFNPYDSLMYRNDSGDELYESLPGDEDYLSDNQPLSGRISRISLHLDESNNESDGSFVSELSDDCSVKPYIPPGVSPVPRRRPVRRKKSGLVHKRSISYVVKPSIMRVSSSTLRRPAKKFGEFFFLFIWLIIQPVSAAK